MATTEPNAERLVSRRRDRPLDRRRRALRRGREPTCRRGHRRRGQRSLRERVRTRPRGNTSNATVGGIRIDRTPPATSASVPEPLASGLVRPRRGGHADDRSRPLRNRATSYSIDGGDAREYDAPFLDARGACTPSRSGASTRPATARSRVPSRTRSRCRSTASRRRSAARARPWRTSTAGTTRRSRCRSTARTPSPASPLAPRRSTSATRCGADRRRSGPGQCREYRACNGRGHQHRPHGARAHGLGRREPDQRSFYRDWYNRDVTVSWTATDGLSGIDTATAPSTSTITAEGRGLSAGPVERRGPRGEHHDRRVLRSARTL